MGLSWQEPRWKPSGLNSHTWGGGAALSETVSPNKDLSVLRCQLVLLGGLENVLRPFVLLLFSTYSAD